MKTSNRVIEVDFSKPCGEIKPLHGVNNSPIKLDTVIDSFVEAGIPFVRTHDTAGAYGGAHFIDIANIFRNFDADEKDPASYDFAFTDSYLQSLVKSGCQIFYRLGCTIENNYRVKAYNIYPPADFGKWARICEGIIRHYNEGWADGFHFDIQYWEIWNEPENKPMWLGTMEQFFEFYKVVSNYLKRTFPHLKIGGYGSCGFYSVTRENTSDFYKNFLVWFDGFLQYLRMPGNSSPLDFFSWHFYALDDADEIVRHAEYAQQQLRKYGFDKTENIFNEWNFIDWGSPTTFDDTKEMPGASFVAEAFCRMQNSPIDKAMYYDAMPNRAYCGLFYFPSQRVTPAYYAFKAFNYLYLLKQQVAIRGLKRRNKLQALAAGNASHGAILLTNRTGREQHVELSLQNGPAMTQILCLDAKHLLKPVPVPKKNILTLPSQSVFLVLCGFDASNVPRTEFERNAHHRAGLDDGK